MKHFLRETDQFFAEHMPPVTRRVLYLCTAIFVLNILVEVLFGRTSQNPVTGEIHVSVADRIFMLIPAAAVLQGHVWEFVTYMFSHGSFAHLFANMLGLFFFGGIIENQMGGRRFLWFILLAGLMAGFAHTGLAFATGHTEVRLIGFSGALYAILVAAVIWFPRMRVLVMFLFPVPLRVLAAIFGALMVLSMVDSMRRFGPMGGGVSELAHVVGVLVGLVLVKNPGILDFFEDMRLPGMRRRPRKVSRTSMGHPGRHTDPDDRYNDPHWKLDQ